MAAIISFFSPFSNNFELNIVMFSEGRSEDLINSDFFDIHWGFWSILRVFAIIFRLA